MTDKAIKKYKVFISPSTQEDNKGVGTYGNEEKRMNNIADHAIVELSKFKDRIEVKRNDPKGSVGASVLLSDKWGADLHVAIHSDAGPKAARGCTVFVYKLGGRSEKFAKILYRRISALSPAVDRGIKSGPGLYEPRETNCPSALIELSFHSNPDDARWIAANEQVIGKEIARAIIEYFDL